MHAVIFMCLTVVYVLHSCAYFQGQPSCTMRVNITLQYTADWDSLRDTIAICIARLQYNSVRPSFDHGYWIHLVKLVLGCPFPTE